MDIGTEYFVLYKRVFVINEFAVTEFQFEISLVKI